jgi:hypothetical protein
MYAVVSSVRRGGLKAMVWNTTQMMKCRQWGSMRGQGNCCWSSRRPERGEEEEEIEAAMVDETREAF